MSGLFDSVSRMEGAMTFHRDRHSVLSGNVANVDTPGYKPFDVERTVPDEASPEALRTTEEGHLDASGETASSTRLFEDAGEYQTADGNGVDLERELAKIDANRVRYSATSSLVSRRLALLKYAATDGVG